MKTKKSSKVDIQKFRVLLLELGLVIALSLTLLAFEWKSSFNYNPNLLKYMTANLFEEDIPVTLPDDVKPPPPPPPIKGIDFINVLDNTVDIYEEPDIFDNLDPAFFNPDNLPPINSWNEKEFKEEEIFVDVSQMPSFKGDFRQYLTQNLVYPEVAKRNGLQGRVYLHFVVESDGSITNVRVIRGVDPLLDREAKKVIENSPLWNPGMQRDIPVRVYFQMTISFALR